jgi:hypothetical protein
MVASEGNWKRPEHKGHDPNAQANDFPQETALDLLAKHRIVRWRAALVPDEARAWAASVEAAARHWTKDFGGDQFALGRAFYTHLETGRSRHYFREAAASDALVERILPGMQARIRALYSELVGAPVLPRSGWCGPGVHVFPEDGPVARTGGIIHFDTEGFEEIHHTENAAALSLVVMLRPPKIGGELRVWGVDYAGDDAPALPPGILPLDASYEAGDALLFASRTLHQIRPFSGGGPRISITAHALQDPTTGAWTSWF